jgi:hypothetical protein
VAVVLLLPVAALVAEAEDAPDSDAEAVDDAEAALLDAFDALALLLAEDELLLVVPTELLLEQCIIVMPATKAAGQAEKINFRFMGEVPPSGAW